MELFNLNKLQVNPKDKLILSYNPNEIDVDSFLQVYDILKNEFPENTIIAMPMACSLKLFDPKDLIEIKDKINEILGDTSDYE